MNSLPMTRRVAIAGTGIGLPANVLTAADLDQRLGLAPGESLRATGIRQRHTAVHETAAQLAASATREALADAGLAWEEIDCMICASATMDQALPYNAAMVLAEIGGPHRVATVDVGASCLSFLQAMDLASCAIAVGRYRHVLIVSADIASFTTDYRNLRENGHFGDGAAAAILRPAGEVDSSCILASRSITLPEGVDLCRIRSGGSRFHRRGDHSHAQALFEMRGRSLFALVARELPGFVDMLLAESGVAREELELLIPHQASRQALDHLPKLLNIARDRMVDVFGAFGNQVGASLPTALHFAIHRAGLQRGQKALLLGSGAGVSIGGILFTF